MRNSFLAWFHLSLAGSIWLGCILPLRYFWWFLGAAVALCILAGATLVLTVLQGERRGKRKGVGDGDSQKDHRTPSRSPARFQPWPARLQLRSARLQLWFASGVLLLALMLGLGLQGYHSFASYITLQARAPVAQFRIISPARSNSIHPGEIEAQGILVGAKPTPNMRSVPKVMVTVQCRGCPLEMGRLITGRVSWRSQRWAGKPDLSASLSPPFQVSEVPWGLSLALSVRKALAVAIGEYERNRDTPSAAGGILRAITVGDKAGLGPQTVEVLRRSNLSHLTAVSGTHVLCVAWFIFIFLSAFSRVDRVERRAVRISLSILGVVCYAVMVGPSPSVLRATLMSILGACSMIWGQGRNALVILSWSVIFILVTFPFLASGLAFQLSVLATLGLSLFGARVSRFSHRLLLSWCSWSWLKPLAGWLGTNLGVVLVATLSVFPLISSLRGTFNPWGILANLLVVPVVAPLVCGGLLVAFLQLLWPALAQYLLSLLWFLSGYVWWVARVIAALPGSDLPWLEGAAGQVLGFALVLVIFLQAPRVKRCLEALQRVS